MSYAEDIVKLRKRMHDAVSKGLVQENGRNFLEGTLIQIMNDAERNRQNCMGQADTLRKQASTFEGQASAFASVTSIVYNVINGFVNVAEKSEEEEKRVVEEAKERSLLNQNNLIEAPHEKKPGRKKK